MMNYTQNAQVEKLGGEELICNLYKRGVSIDQLTEYFKQSKDEITEVLSNNGLLPSVPAVANKQAPESKSRKPRKANPVEPENTSEYDANLLREEETKCMKALREKGYTNIEIARAIGKSTACVYTRIGTQPDEITRYSFDFARQRAILRNLLRKDAVEQMKARQQNEQAILERIRKEQEAIEQEHRQRVDEIQKIVLIPENISKVVTPEDARNYLLTVHKQISSRLGIA